ncbi:MAG: type IV pilus biogenesis protein PilM [Betaproteobacteria bacterium]|nr:type IV pilus biogenesis protein PilM [Betaproteobacteria bacterium]
MGFALPVILFVAYLGLNAIMARYADNLIPAVSQSMAVIQAQNIIAYRNAVMNFAAANPAYVGTVPINVLQPYLPPGMSPEFLVNNAGNNIAQVQGVGHAIMVYGQNLMPGVTAAMQNVEHGNAGMGSTSANGVWNSNQSVLNGGITQPNWTAMPARQLVFVVVSN